MSTEANNHDEHDAEDAAFAAGFDNQPTEPAADAALSGSGAAAPAATDDANAAPSKGASGTTDESSTDSKAPEVDPFAGLPEAVRNLLGRIPALENQTAEAVQRARTAEGRAAALQSRFDKMSQGNTAADQAPERPKLQRVQALRDQGLPEIADALEEVAAQSARPAAVDGKANAPAEQGTQADAAPAGQAEDPQITALDLARPNWVADVNSSDFSLWLSTQPAEYQQRVARSSQAKDIFAALQDFDKRPRQQPAGQQQPRASRMAAGLTPAGDGRRNAPRGQAQEMDEEAAMAAGFASARG